MKGSSRCSPGPGSRHSPRDETASPSPRLSPSSSGRSARSRSGSCPARAADWNTTGAANVFKRWLPLLAHVCALFSLPGILLTASNSGSGETARPDLPGHLTFAILQYALRLRYIFEDTSVSPDISTSREDRAGSDHKGRNLKEDFPRGSGYDSVPSFTGCVKDQDASWLAKDHSLGQAGWIPLSGARRTAVGV